MTTQPTQTIQEIQINKAVTALDASTKQQQVALDALNGLRDELGSLNEQISVATIQLSELKTEYAIQVRENAIELNIAVREIESHVLKRILEKHGLVSLAKTDLVTLTKRANTAERDVQDEIDNAVHNAVTAISHEYTMRILNLTKDHEVAIAQLNANSSADAKRIKQLEAQVGSLEAKAQAELVARVEIAKAEPNKQGVTVNTGK